MASDTILSVLIICVDPSAVTGAAFLGSWFHYTFAVTPLVTHNAHVRPASPRTSSNAEAQIQEMASQTYASNKPVIALGDGAIANALATLMRILASLGPSSQF